MALLNKLSITATVATSAAAVLVGTVSTPAEAALFKFSFTSDEANGYFIFDNSFPVARDVPIVGEYEGAVTEYKIDLGDQGVFQGTLGTPIVFLVRDGNGISAPEADDFLLEARAGQRQTQFGLESYFSYPKGTFGDSLALPTTVPSTAKLTLYPNVDKGKTIGEAAFTGTVETRIEAVPEPTSLSAVFGVGAWLIFRCRQLRQPLPVQK